MEIQLPIDLQACCITESVLRKLVFGVKSNRALEVLGMCLNMVTIRILCVCVCV